MRKLLSCTFNTADIRQSYAADRYDEPKLVPKHTRCTTKYNSQLQSHRCSAKYYGNCGDVADTVSCIASISIHDHEISSPCAVCEAIRAIEHVIYIPVLEGM